MRTVFVSHGRDFAAAIRRAVMLVLMLSLVSRVHSKEGQSGNGALKSTLRNELLRGYLIFDLVVFLLRYDLAPH